MDNGRVCIALRVRLLPQRRDFYTPLARNTRPVSLPYPARPPPDRCSGPTQLRKIYVKRLISNVAAATLVFLLAAPIAQTALAEGDPLRGKTLGYTCLGCHGIPGYRNAYPSYRVPKLGGQKPAALANALRAYRAGERQHNNMQAQAAVLSDQDIEDIVAWLSQQGPPAADEVEADDVAGLDAAQACVACHGVQGRDATPAPPVLSGQHQSYLRQALLQYQAGERGTNVMTAFAAGLTERDIEEIAAFFAARDGVYTIED